MLYELINGNGYCIYYHWNEKLEFEGEILNGKRNGKGKLYFDNGELKYEGELRMEKKMQKGKNMMMREIYCLKVNI